MKVEQKFIQAFISGATSGIGKELARLLASKDISLILSGRNGTELKKIEAELEDKVTVHIIQADLADSEQRRQLIEQLKINPPDLVINNAGFGIYGNPLESTLQNQQAMIEVNVVAPFEITYELTKFFIESGKKATILNVSSVAGHFAFPYSNIYAASKAFLSHFSVAFDEELKGSGVRILTAAPGQVDTEFAKRAAGFRLKKYNRQAVMSAEFAAKQIWKQIYKQKTYYIFDWKYRLLIFFSKIFSMSLLAKMLKKRIKERIDINENIHL